MSDTTVPTINYTEAVVNSINVMGISKNILKTNIGKNTAERALFARYVVHLVGDIHQPLHSVALFNKTYPSGDTGGNKLTVTLLNSTKSNFHSFWDAGGYRLQNDSWVIVRPMNLQNLTVLKEVANNMVNQYGKEVE